MEIDFSFPKQGSKKNLHLNFEDIQKVGCKNTFPKNTEISGAASYSSNLPLCLWGASVRTSPWEMHWKGNVLPIISVVSPL